MAEITYIDSRRGTGLTQKSAKGVRTDIVHCLMIPLENDSLLLPNTAVAEVVAYHAPEPMRDAPEWFLGWLPWRELRVPVISFESAIGGRSCPPASSSRIAVVNTLNGNRRVPYIGVLSQGIPQLRMINDANVVPNEEVSVPAPSVASYARYNDAPVLVPDIDDLEIRLERLLQG
jgi:chemosensory pili system protein ChpC